MTQPISDAEWFAIREAARRLDFDDVARRAERLGFGILAHHAKRARSERASLDAVWFGLLLDRPDEPDPFKEMPNA